jgi:hypothetical protein
VYGVETAPRLLVQRNGTVLLDGDGPAIVRGFVRDAKGCSFEVTPAHPMRLRVGGLPPEASFTVRRDGGTPESPAADRQGGVVLAVHRRTHFRLGNNAAPGTPGAEAIGDAHRRHTAEAAASPRDLGV